MSLFTATSSFVASPSWDISSLSSALFTELASALAPQRRIHIIRVSLSRYLLPQFLHHSLSPPSPSLGRSVPGLKDMDRGDRVSFAAYTGPLDALGEERVHLVHLPLHLLRVRLARQLPAHEFLLRLERRVHVSLGGPQVELVSDVEEMCLS